ncbi:MAG: hypothetical protein SFZ23_08770 [Planctomycetota bacterium]|nr:hypothetical protein [Planctomycetota bacterium]
MNIPCPEVGTGRRDEADARLIADAMGRSDPVERPAPPPPPVPVAWLDTIDQAVDATHPDQILAALSLIEAIKALTKRLEGRVEDAAISYITAHGDITDGVRRYYVGPNKRTKARDSWAVLQALLETMGGDLRSVADCLASDCWKPGACRRLLGDAVANSLFETVVTQDLKTGEPGKPRLQKVDPRFTGGGA